MFKSLDAHLGISGQFVAYLVVGYVVRRFQRSFRRPENLRHFLVFHFVEISHLKHKSLLARKFRNRAIKRGLCLVTVEICVAFDIPDGRRFKAGGRKTRKNIPFSQKIQAFIYCYSVYPSIYLRIITKLREIPPNLNIAVLEHIIRIVM